MIKGLTVRCLPAKQASLEFSEKFLYFISQRSDCTLEFAGKRNSMSSILGDVARYTESVNFTFLIMVGNLFSTKTLACSKAKLRNWKVAFSFIYVIYATLFSLTKYEGKLFLVPKSSALLFAELPHQGCTLPDISKNVGNTSSKWDKKYKRLLSVNQCP